MELWDAYDSSFHRIDNIVLERGQIIPCGLFHLVCEVIVRHSDGTYLLMQRAFEKHLGGMWELTAGGSALKGESPLVCACRELREETGIQTNALKEIGRLVHEAHHGLYVEYLCVTDCPKEAILLQPGETIAYQWVSPIDLKRMKPDVFASSRTMQFVD